MFISKEALNKSIHSASGQYFGHFCAKLGQIRHHIVAIPLFFCSASRKRADCPLYQVTESFRPAMASAYKLAQANMAYSRFSFFFRPRYTVFL